MNEDWIQWDGGPMPADVDEETRVLLSFRDGQRSKIRRAGDLRWSHNALVDDIMAYAIISEGGNSEDA
jgi:hypothetical protein